MKSRLENTMEDLVSILQEVEETNKEDKETLLREFGCESWLCVHGLIFEETLKDKSIKKRDIADDCMSAFIIVPDRTGLPIKQWVRVYKNKKLSKLSEQKQ